MGRGRLPDGAGVDPVVEEHDQRGPPVPADRERGVPPPRPPHPVGGEVQGVEFGLGQVVPAGHVPLRPGLREPGRGVDEFLLPGPGEDGPQVLAGLVRGPAGVRPLVRDRPLVHPVEELPDVLPLELLDRDPAAPLVPLPEGRAVLVAGPAGQGLGPQVALGRGGEGRSHRGLSDAAGRGSDLLSDGAGGIAQGVLLPRPPVEGGDGCQSKWSRRTISESVPDESVGGATERDIGPRFVEVTPRKPAPSRCRTEIPSGSLRRAG